MTDTPKRRRQPKAVDLAAIVAGATEGLPQPSDIHPPRERPAHPPFAQYLRVVEERHIGSGIVPVEIVHPEVERPGHAQGRYSGVRTTPGDAPQVTYSDGRTET